MKREVDSLLLQLAVLASANLSNTADNLMFEPGAIAGQHELALPAVEVGLLIPEVHVTK